MTLNEGWKTWITEATHLKGNFMMPAKTVNIPHNWDDYYGYRQLTHGNLHGTAMYVKDFTADVKSGKRYFLRFDGVGTYATITVNGKSVIPAESPKISSTSFCESISCFRTIRAL